MTQDERKVFELALEALEEACELIGPAWAWRDEKGRPATTAMKELLAQPGTPHEIGQRIAKTCGGISHLWSAVSQDDEIAEAERGFKEALAQPEQEPVAMKFKIYKPTVPDPMRQDINDALLPWVYDQSRGSGFVASMWVTPVSTLPPQRTWAGLTDEQAESIQKNSNVRTALLNYSVARNDRAAIALVKAIAAHGIKE